ncbi:MAG: dynamin family protein [Hyphomicrobiaceae bacterium]
MALATLKPFATLGAPLEEVRRDLIRGGSELAQLLEPMEASIVEEAARTLRSQICRIAVVGQIKAGKSSFISALADHPNLLPNDVNPWTTVVTNLHFRGDDAGGDSAVFTFFAPGEWRRIAEGGGLLRELTERLVPGFNPSLLRLQLDALRQRAERRLGREFQSLLGQQHKYSSITRELVERYVSAGNEAAGPAGQYSDITKVADLHFGGERSGYPVTVIDTPGTNDPFMVRDEITRQSLTAADIYIVVLTAQQPLATADLALLRILRGLHKEHVIIFINRIDQLQDTAADCRKLIEHVRERISDEFGATDVPIIVGSAKWGNHALSSTPAEARADVTAAFGAYAKTLGVPLPKDGAPDADDDVLRNALFTCSGIPKTIQAVNSKLLKGGNAYVLGQLAAFLSELAKTGEALHAAERRSLAQFEQAETANQQLHAEQTHGWKKELEQLNLIADQTLEIVTAFQDSLASIVTPSAEDIRGRLDAIVERFIEEQTERLVDAMHGQPGARVWRCSAAPLRDAMESAFAKIYGHAETRILDIETVVRKHFDQQYRRFDKRLGLGQATTPSRPPAPPMMLMASPVALDLEYPWWSAWWQGRPTEENRSRALRQLVEADFKPLAEQLTGSAEAHLNKQVTTMVRHVTAVQAQVHNSLRRRTMALTAKLEAPARPADGSSADALRRAKMAEGADNSVRWSAITRHLADINQRCIALVSDPGRSIS